MIDLQELRKAAEWLNKERNDLPKDANIMDFEDRKIQIVPSQFIELIDRLEAAEKVCKIVIKHNLCFEGQQCTCFPEMLNDYCKECSNKNVCQALAAWQKVKEASNDV